MALSTKRPSKAEKTRSKIMADVTDSTVPTKRLNAEIEATLYQKIKMRSVEEGCSISEITRDLWIEYLGK